MSGHTKEPWEVFVPCEITADDPTGRFSHALVCDTYNSPNPKADSNRIVECVNALAGYNPAALAALVEAAEAARNRIWCLEAGAIADGKTELAQKFESWANELSVSLTAFRAGEAS